MNPITCGMAADLLPLYLDGCYTTGQIVCVDGGWSAI